MREQVHVGVRIGRTYWVRVCVMHVCLRARVYNNLGGYEVEGQFKY